MNWDLFVTLVFAVGSLLMILQFVLFMRQIERLQDRHKQRETEYLKIIRDLHNRLTAKDLSGYMALRTESEKPPSTNPYGMRSDEAEAEMEEMQLGLTRASSDGV